MTPDGVVIAGAGQAGFQVAASLRTEGYNEPITLIGDEPSLPYQRPPLSKGFMAGKQEIESTALRPLAFYESHGIELVTGARVTGIDRVDRSVRLGSGPQSSLRRAGACGGSAQSDAAGEGRGVGWCLLPAHRCRGSRDTATPGAGARYRRDRRRIHRPGTCGCCEHAGEIGSRAGGAAEADAEGDCAHPFRFLSRRSHAARA